MYMDFPWQYFDVQSLPNVFKTDLFPFDAFRNQLFLLYKDMTAKYGESFEILESTTDIQFFVEVSKPGGLSA